LYFNKRWPITKFKKELEKKPFFSPNTRATVIDYYTETRFISKIELIEKKSSFDKFAIDKASLLSFPSY